MSDAIHFDEKAFTPVEPLRVTVEGLLDHDLYTDEKVITECSLAEVEEMLAWSLETMKNSRRRWVVIVEPLNDDQLYVQALITSAGSIWAECVSNQYLEGDHQLDVAQGEFLPTLGWEWPSPPASPNWHFHDELLNSGTAVAGLMSRTLRLVFGVTDDDHVRIIVLPIAEKEHLVDRR